MILSNAGYGLFGAAEELSDEQLDHMVATNPVGADPADPFRAPAARPGWRAHHSTVVIRRACRVPGQLDVPRHEVGHRELDQEPAPVRMVLGSSALDNTLSVLKGADRTLRGPDRACRLDELSRAEYDGNVTDYRAHGVAAARPAARG